MPARNLQKARKLRGLQAQLDTSREVINRNKAKIARLRVEIKTTRKGGA